MNRKITSATEVIFLWSDFLNSLEPILAQSADVATPPSTASRAAPHQPPPLHFSEISPRRISFLAEKGLAGGGVVALATWRLIQKVYNDFL